MTNKPEDFTLIPIIKDPRSSERSFFAVFNKEGEYVHLKFKNDRIINPNRAFNKQRLKDLGFTIKTHEVQNYLEEKNLQLYPKCRCLIPNDLVENKDECTPKDCVQPTKVMQINLRY